MIVAATKVLASVITLGDATYVTAETPEESGIEVLATDNSSITPSKMVRDPEPENKGSQNIHRKGADRTMLGEERIPRGVERAKVQNLCNKPEMVYMWAWAWATVTNMLLGFG